VAGDRVPRRGALVPSRADRADEPRDGSDSRGTHRRELRDAAFGHGRRTRRIALPRGAALVGTTGEVVIGCNVENAAYPSSICAERGAVMTAVARGIREFDRLVIATEADEPASPCGSAARCSWSSRRRSPS
jgi:hypothetical protein